MTRTLTLVIESDPMLAWDLFGRPKTMEAGVTTAATPSGAVLRFQGQREMKALDMPAVLTVALELTHDVALGVFASWLYDKLKGGRARRLHVDRVEVVIDEGEIKRILVQRFEQD